MAQDYDNPHDKTLESSESLVSIGIPTYNRPQGLDRALASIQQQTYKKLDVIISDNCSPDPEVKKIVEKYIAEGLPIRYFRHPENYGIEFNFCFVRDNSIGDYFMWLCDDDWISPDYIEECLKAFLADPDTTLATGITVSHRPAIQITDKTPFARVKHYFTNFEYTNVMIFSLMRGEKARSHEFKKKVYGADWIWVADFLYMGKLYICNNAKMYISNNGISKNPKQFASSLTFKTRSLSLPFSRAFVPPWAIACGYFRHVLKGMHPYDKISFFYRFFLGGWIAAIILKASTKSIILHLLKKILPEKVVLLLNKYVRRKSDRDR